MNLVNLISSLHKDDKAILKMAIDRKHLSAFLKYLEDFQGDIEMKTCYFREVTNGNLMYLPATGLHEMDKIKTIKKIRECMEHLPTTYSIQGLRLLKDFVEKNGSLKLDERAIKNFKEAGIEVNWIE